MPTYLGSTADDSLIGSAGRDVIAGRDGNDTIDDGGGGPDELIGGNGNDTYFVSDTGDTIVENVGEGIDTVRTALAAFVLTGNVENLIYTGAGSFAGRGNAGDNVIIGGAGNDVLSGFDGRDVIGGGDGDDLIDGGTGVANQLQGGRGNDIYLSNVPGDTLVEFLGDGIDTVRTALSSFVLAANIENLLFTGSGAFTGTGNAEDNVLIGNAGDDRLLGLVGRDVLGGGAGDDWLDGGTGSNELIGGVGNDTFVTDSTGDTLVELAGEGIDTVRTALATYTLRANFERLVFTGNGAFVGTGNAADNVIFGGGGNDQLFGLDGRDVLIGGAGADILSGGTDAPNELYGGADNDSYFVDNAGDTIVELADGGFDAVFTSLASFLLAPNIEILNFAGTGFFRGTGNDQNNVISGGDQGNLIDGRGGDDMIRGGSGQDTLIGGAGDDILQFGSVGDTLLGGEGNDRLEGAGGRLEGGNGDDSYALTTTETVIVELLDSGTDTLIGSTASLHVGGYVLPANVENFLWASTTGSVVITGNGLTNFIDLSAIQSGTGTNVISGRDGNDLLVGGRGGTNRFIGGNDNDYMTGSGLTIDRFEYYGGETGVDRIDQFRSREDKIALSNTGFFHTTVIGFSQSPNPVATEAVSTFLYNTVTGMLAYDADGNGPGVPVMLAEILGRPVLDLGDFIFF